MPFGENCRIIHTGSVSRDPILQMRTPRFAPEPRAFKARARLHGPLLQQEWHPVCCAGDKAETLLAMRPGFVGSFSKGFQDVTSTAPGAVWGCSAHSTTSNPFHENCQLHLEGLGSSAGISGWSDSGTVPDGSSRLTRRVCGGAASSGRWRAEVEACLCSGSDP